MGERYDGPETVCSWRFRRYSCSSWACRYLQSQGLTRRFFAACVQKISVVLVSSRMDATKQQLLHRSSASKNHIYLSTPYIGAAGRLDCSCMPLSGWIMGEYGQAAHTEFFRRVGAENLLPTPPEEKNYLVPPMGIHHAIAQISTRAAGMRSQTQG